MALLMILGSCGGRGGEDAGKETPRQIEKAANAGREAARKVITRQFADSMEFHGALLEANAEKSRYRLDSLPRCEAAYDSAFISTIRTTRPDLADMLKR